MYSHHLYFVLPVAKTGLEAKKGGGGGGESLIGIFFKETNSSRKSSNNRCMIYLEKQKRRERILRWQGFSNGSQSELTKLYLYRTRAREVKEEEEEV